MAGRTMRGAWHVAGLLAAAAGVIGGTAGAAVFDTEAVAKFTDTKVNFAELRVLNGQTFGGPMGQPYEVIGLSLSRQTIVADAALGERVGAAVRSSMVNVDERSTEQSFAFGRSQKAVGISFLSKAARQVRVEIYDMSGKLLDAEVMQSSAGMQFVGFVREARDISRVRVVSVFESIEQALAAPTLIDQVSYRLFHEFESEGLLEGGVGMVAADFGLPEVEEGGSAGFSGASAGRRRGSGDGEGLGEFPAPVTPGGGIESPGVDGGGTTPDRGNGGNGNGSAAGGLPPGSIGGNGGNGAAGGGGGTGSPGTGVIRPPAVTEREDGFPEGFPEPTIDPPNVFVPEPAALGAMSIISGALLARRRR